VYRIDTGVFGAGEDGECSDGSGADCDGLDEVYE